MNSDAGLRELGDDLWTWTARHPDWHPRTEFGSEVAGFALLQGDDLLLVDPLLPEDGGVAAELDGLAAGRLIVLITIPYHVRSAEALWRRHGDRVEILGHAAVAKRLSPGAPFRAVGPGDELPHGASMHRIGNPRRQEQPLLVPSHGALAFGDAVVGVEGELRAWVQSKASDKRLAWYRDRLVPSLEPLLELDFDRVLVTHGAPVLRGGREALRAALEAPPWYHRG